MELKAPPRCMQELVRHSGTPSGSSRAYRFPTCINTLTYPPLPMQSSTPAPCFARHLSLSHSTDHAVILGVVLAFGLNPPHTLGLDRTKLFCHHLSATSHSLSYNPSRFPSRQQHNPNPFILRCKSLVITYHPHS